MISCHCSRLVFASRGRPNAPFGMLINSATSGSRGYVPKYALVFKAYTALLPLERTVPHGANLVSELSEVTSPRSRLERSR